MTPPPDLDHTLKSLGYERFRPGQREAIETLFSDNRLLLVAPTGGGKSLTYQLPATLLRGTTLVVSPLVALMNDQVQALVAKGVPATYLAATLAADENRRRTARIAAGEFALVYVAPERLMLPGFRALLQRLEIPLLVVDEAHCISQWGHDFRPEYLDIAAVVAELPRARVLACTATATPIVRDEILARLGLPPDTAQHVHGFARPNLHLRAQEIERAAQRQTLVERMLLEALGAAQRRCGVAIVYAPTRRSAEEEAERLSLRGWRTSVYHAGLSAERRAASQHAFLAGELDVMVATNAFGMGIDRPDVRAVVHLAPPGSIEAYYQEVGRAGRDGAEAYGLMLVAPGDMPRRRRLLEGDGGSAEVLAHKWGLFLELMRWVEGGSCRHDAILRYFGDEAETLDGCGKCDVCETLRDGGASAETVSLVVRKALSAVARLHLRFGLQMVARLLRGETDERLARAGLDRTPTFGALRDYPETWLLRLLRRCVTAGWVDFTGGDRPMVVLTDAGRAVMRAERPARLLLPSQESELLAASGQSRRDRGSPRRSSAADDEVLDPAARALFEALRSHRLVVARQEGVPPFVVASDRTLRDIATQRPRTLGALLDVHGIGQAKAERFGAGFLDVVGRAASA